MDNFSSTPPAYTKERKPFPKKLIFLTLLLLLLIAGGIAGIRYFATQKDALVSPAASPTVTGAPTPTAVTSTVEPTPAGSPTTAAPTGKATPTTAAGTTSSARSSITVSILNGSGVAGAASKVSTTLRDLGYKIGTVGNADTYDYTDVSISVKKSKATILSQLRKDLASYTIGSTSATLKESDAADAVVIVGK